MSLPFKNSVNITIPDGFTIREIDADGAGVYALVTSTSQAKILTYPVTGGAAQHSLDIAYDATWHGLAKYGDGWVVAGRYRLVPFSRLGNQGQSGGNDFQFTDIWSVDWDERNDRFVAWGTLGSHTYNRYNLQVRTFDKDYAPNNLASFVLATSLKLKTVYTDPGFMTQHGAKWVFISPNGSTQRVVITDANFVELVGETQVLPSDPLRGIASRNGQLIMATDGRLHFYGTEISPVVGKSHRQLPFPTPYTNQYDIVRPSDPIQVIVTDAAMVKQVKRGFEGIGADGTIEKVEGVIRIIPKWTVPGVEEGDKVFLHTGPAGVAPTAIPNDAYTVDDLDEVGNVLQQQIYCKD